MFRTPDSALTKSGLGLAERAAHVALALAFTAGARQLALTAVLITTLATGTMPVGDLERRVGRILLKARFRARHPERGVRLPILDALSLAEDIDTEEEARAAAAVVAGS